MDIVVTGRERIVEICDDICEKSFQVLHLIQFTGLPIRGAMDEFVVVLLDLASHVIEMELQELATSESDDGKVQGVSSRIDLYRSDVLFVDCILVLHPFHHVLLSGFLNGSARAALDHPFLGSTGSQKHGHQ